MTGAVRELQAGAAAAAVVYADSLRADRAACGQPQVLQPAADVGGDQVVRHGR